jgi:hypothetical protein
MLLSQTAAGVLHTGVLGMAFTTIFDSIISTGYQRMYSPPLLYSFRQANHYLKVAVMGEVPATEQYCLLHLQE